MRIIGVNQRARVKLTSANRPKLNGVTGEIMTIGRKTGIRVKKVTIMPTRLKMVGKFQYTKSEPFRKWITKMDNRVIEFNADKRVLKKILELKIPDEVFIELSLEDNQ